METGVHYPLRIGALPRGWRAGCVGDFAREIEPGFASGEHNQTGEGVAHLRPMNVDREGKIDLSVTKFVSASKDGRRLAVGDVLFNNTNSPELVGKTATVNVAGDFAFSNHMTRIRFADDVLPKFGALQLHFLWMRGYFKYNCVKHVNQASVSSRALARVVPFVWAPPVEQERIVAEIEKQFSRLDEAVANLRRAREKIAAMRRSVLDAAALGQLSNQHAENGMVGEDLAGLVLAARRRKWVGTGRYKEPVAPDPELAVEVPRHWAKLSWEAILQPEDGAFKRGPFGSSLTKAMFVGQGYKVYEQYCPINDDCSFARYYIDATKFEHMRDFAVRAGDFLISCSGVTLGRITRVPDVFEPGIINQALLRVRVDPHVVEPAFFKMVFRSPTFQGFLVERSAGVAIPNLRGVGQLKAIPFPVPPLGEQREIVTEVERCLSIVHEVEAEVDANLKRARALRQAILGHALGGLGHGLD